jgi:maltose O-acetyltransferase
MNREEINKEIIFKEGFMNKKNYIMMVLLTLKFLYIIPVFRKFISYWFIPNSKDIDFFPGFFAFYGKNIYANNVYLGDTFFLDYAPIFIGENTKFSLQNIVITGSHDKKNWGTVIAKPVTIGKNVWVTTRCIILQGVTIGDNVIISAGSVVVSDIPSNCIAGGNPAKVIKFLE